MDRAPETFYAVLSTGDERHWSAMDVTLTVDIHPRRQYLEPTGPEDIRLTRTA